MNDDLKKLSRISRWESVRNYWYLTRYLRQCQDVLFWSQKIFKTKKVKLLDFGCGIGQNVLILTKLGFKVRGLEIRKHREWKLIGDYFDTYDGKTVPYKSGSFNVVTIFGVLEHLGRTPDEQDRKEYLRQIRDILSTSGLIFVYNFPNKYAPGELLNNIIKLPSSHRSTEKMGQKELKKLVKQAGFKILEAGRSGVLPAYLGSLSPALRDKVINRFFRQLDLFDQFIDNLFGGVLGQSNYIIAQKV